MDCRVIEVRQGSEQWETLRRCRITASRLADVMAKPTTLRYQNYQRMIVQQLCGYDVEEEDKPWFQHGKELEPAALAAYQWKYDIELDHDLFFVHKEHDWFGGSPDGFNFDEPHGIEVKCRALYKNYRKYAVRGSVAPENRHQVQGQMWLSGLSEWWYVNYYEGPDYHGELQRKLHRIKVDRDDKLIAQMEIRAMEFMHECYELAGVGR